MASLIYHFKTSRNTFIYYFFVSVVMSGFMLFYRIMAGLNLNRPLNYTDMGSIYSSVTPMNLYYNDEVIYPDGSEESTSDFMTIVKNSVGQSTIELRG